MYKTTGIKQDLLCIFVCVPFGMVEEIYYLLLIIAIK